MAKAEQQPLEEGRPTEVVIDGKKVIQIKVPRAVIEKIFGKEDPRIGCSITHGEYPKSPLHHV